MKKLLLIALTGIALFLGVSFAGFTEFTTTPADQYAISGTLVSRSMHVHNSTGTAYLKAVLPHAGAYDLAYQSASITPINNALLSLGAEHDPIFLINSGSTATISLTGKMTTSNRTFPALAVNILGASDTAFASVFTSAVVSVTPIADLLINKTITGSLALSSGSMITYLVTLQNIGSSIATGIQVADSFPIPLFGLPSAAINGNPIAYNTPITYPNTFVRDIGSLYPLTPGQSITLVITSTLMQQAAVGTSFGNTAQASTVSAEYTTGNNTKTVTGTIVSPADLYITKTMQPFTGYQAGSIVRYTITYGNSGGTAATNVVIQDIAPATVTLPTTTRNIATLPAGSGGTITLTGTLNTTMQAGQTFVNTANITSANVETSTGNNTSTITGTIASLPNIILDMQANNLTRPQLDNAPYGSGPTIRIQAVSGDLVQLTINYVNSGNTSASNAGVTLTGLGGFVQHSNPNGSIGTLGIGANGTIIMTGIVGPQNYISFTPIATLTYNTGQTVTDSVIIQEPFVCGDGLLTRTEQCDTLGPLGNLITGQVCENQQGICVIVTKSIINTACMNYQYTNPITGFGTGQICSSVEIPVGNPSCVSLAGTSPVNTSSGYAITFTCQGNGATSSTPISIDCGNGMLLSGYGSLLTGTCQYATGFVGNAQCRVANDTNNPVCRQPVSINAGMCRSLDALDGTLIILDDNNEASARFRCRTQDNVEAQNITIDCGNGDTYTENNVSSLTHRCDYDENADDIPVERTVRCTVDGGTNSNCTQDITLDEDTFGRCGDGIRQGYEDCDDGDLNGTSQSNCTIGCDLRGSAMAACFSVNENNISVQEDEMLPFRWRIDGEKNFASSCTEDTVGKIRKNSLQCEFKIFNGTHPEGGEGGDYNAPTIDTFTIAPCDKDQRTSAGDYGNPLPLFQYLYNQRTNIRSLQKPFGRYYVDMGTLDLNGVYGEYALSLAQVSYEYCDAISDTEDDTVTYEWVDGTPIDRVCSSDFTVTKPYLAQKSSFGLTPKSTTINLDGYRDIFGNDIIKKTDLDKIMVLNASAYEGGTAVQSMMNDFITKYDKLAITIDKTKVPALNKPGITSIKVVPQQKIYILEGTAGTTATISPKDLGDTPFTIVTKNIDLVIKGNVSTNGMFLVKGGKIVFENDDTIVGGDRCPNTQVVQGIFVTDEGFGANANEDLTNDNLQKLRCSHGGLHVKGVLIGGGLESLVQDRRSQLNHRFMVGGSSDAYILAERRNEIFNGAAVLIEYSPSLRSALPPGASEFTKALDVYKK